MKMQKRLCLLLALLICIGLLTACNANEEKPNTAGGEGEAPGLSQPGEDTPSLPEAQKQIRTVWLNAETEDLDQLLTSVEARIAELGGYVESRKIINGGSRNEVENRHAELTVRIPAEKLDRLTGQIADAAKITFSKENTENIALSYVAIKSRITALKAEEARLLELIAKTTTTEEQLKVEQRLTQVRTELEEENTQLQMYENLVDYGTVYLSLTEILESTEEEQTETLWDRISGGFVKSMKDLGNGFAELFVFLIVALPYLAVLAVVGLVIGLLVRRKRKKKEKTEEE